MEEIKPVYKLTLHGDEISVDNKEISENIARKIMFLIMGGEIASSSEMDQANNLPHRTQNSSSTSQSPKHFMATKKPSSEIERLTCLAYYLYKYRNKPAFKTQDLNKLNREAAQPDFSNATVFARNAVQAEYLSKAGGGSKQITIFGEEIVEALPDREKVKKIIEGHRSRRRKNHKQEKS